MGRRRSRAHLLAVATRLRRPRRCRVRCWHSGHGAAAREFGPPPAASRRSDSRDSRIGRVDEQRDGVAVGTSSCSNSSRFGASSACQMGYAGDVAARPVEAGDEAEPGPDRRRLRRRSEWSWSPPWPQVPQGCRSRRSRPPDGEPDRPPAPAVDRIDPPPSDIRSPRSGPRHSRFRSGPGGMRPTCARKPRAMQR